MRGTTLDDMLGRDERNRKHRLAQPTKLAAVALGAANCNMHPRVRQ